MMFARFPWSNCSGQLPSRLSFPRKRESRTSAPSVALDPRFRGGDKSKTEREEVALIQAARLPRPLRALQTSGSGEGRSGGIIGANGGTHAQSCADDRRGGTAAVRRRGGAGGRAEQRLAEAVPVPARGLRQADAGDGRPAEVDPALL